MSSSTNNRISSIPTVCGLESIDELLRHDSDEEQPIQQPRVPQQQDTVAQEPGPSADDITKYGPLFALNGLQYVKLSEHEDQPSQKGSRNVNTRLIGIGDFKAADISFRHLRNWALREKLKTRQQGKGELCVAIAAYVKQHRLLQARGIDSQAPEQIYARTKINFVRAINVLANELFKSKLVHRGTQIGRAELDEGVQADEDLWKDFASLYNDGNDEELGQLKYVVNWHGNPPDPSSFSTITWKKAEQAFKDMSSRYDMAHKKWKQSGFHDEFEAVPFTEFAGVQWLVYLHEFVQENPGLLRVVTSDLEEETHFETGTGMSDNEQEVEDNNSGTASVAASGRTPRGRRRRRVSTANSTSNKKKRPSERDDIFRQFAETQAKTAESAESKNAAVSYSALSMTRDTVRRGLDVAQKKRQGAIRNLKTHPFTEGDNHRARQIVRTVRKKIDPSPAKSDTSEALVYSQSTTASIRAIGSFDTVFGHGADIVDSEKEIARRSDELQHLEKKLRDSQK